MTGVEAPAPSLPTSVNLAVAVRGADSGAPRSRTENATVPSAQEMRATTWCVWPKAIARPEPIAS